MGTFAGAADATPDRQADVDERIPARPVNPPDVEPAQRDVTLGGGWQKSQDRLWTTSGDATGFHILVAEASTGYTWRTAATLTQGGMEADQWIGNACLTASGRRVVAVYAPRTFTNQEKLFDRGGFTAVVDLVSGAVTELPVRTSLAYFNPGCGAGENAVLTQGADQDLGKTGLLTLNAETGALGARIEVPGQLTSPVPTANGIVAADADSVVQVTADGKRTVLAETAGVPMHLAPDANGGVAFIDRDGPSKFRVRRAESVADVKVKTATLASGRPQQIGIARGAANKVFIVGKPDTVNALPSSVARIAAPAEAEVSTTGETVLIEVKTAPVDDPAEPSRVAVSATSLKTGKAMAFTVDPGDSLTPRSAPTDDPGRFCSVPRNDPGTQVYQPKPKQVEWAVNMAVKGHLEIQRPADWRNNDLGAYRPQDLFPQIPLANTNNGQVPAQVLLGVLGQESNLWQASRLIYPGETGNPLIGNYYGINLYDGKPENDWDVDFTKADCGYGVSQMTDGMRLAGHEKPGETALPWVKQKAIATDYVANVAAGLQMLQRKWNEVQGEGLTLNNNDPAKPENWFFAVWAYNSGYHFRGEPDSAGAYGLGWQNNPANPKYPETRPTFGTYATDFAHPQDWPYPEKVLGFAGNTPSIFEAPGVEVPMFRPAWWNGGSDGGRTWKEAMRPFPQHFCTSANQCEYGKKYVPDYPGTRPGDPDSPGDVVGEPAGPCAHKNGRFYDLKCWWHDSSVWKGDCAVSCGNEKIRYDYPEYAAEPENGISFPPNCDLRTVPPGAMVIDELPNETPPVRGACDKPANAGKFEMTFGRDFQGREPSKVDLHQIGGGFGAHFWFSHTNSDDAVGAKLKVTGSWTLNQSLNSWARVYVHIPDHGAHTRNARYHVDMGNKTTSRVLPQRIRANQWVSLGSFPFAGVPKITLTNITEDGKNVEDVAWDAIAIKKLDVKPANMIVAMGDSYASGEGASVSSGADYYPESDVDGKDKNGWRDACHRSRKSWPRMMTLAGNSTPVGTRSDTHDVNVEHRMVACSGARIRNLLQTGGMKDAWGNAAGPSYSEVAQLDSGWVDENTTLVTVSAGGNDARFAKILALCTYWPTPCQDTNIDNEPQPLKVTEPELIEGKVKQSMITLVDEIHRVGRNAKILLMGYPRLFSDFAGCAVGIELSEFEWITQMGDKLNAVLADVVRQAKAKNISIEFGDPTTDFMGQGVCGNPQVIHALVTTLTPGDDPLFEFWPGKGFVSGQGYHPRIEGAARYAVTANRTLRALGL
jgi:hypothetical protein